MVGFLLLLLVIGTAHSDSLSEISIQDMLEVEQQLIINFGNYAKELEERLRVIKG